MLFALIIPTYIQDLYSSNFELQNLCVELDLKPVVYRRNLKIRFYEPQQKFQIRSHIDKIRYTTSDMPMCKKTKSTKLKSA